MQKRTLEIAGITVSDSSKCFVIAEIGHNHQGKVSLAKEMIKAAADSGASAVKLQKRNNKSLFTQDYYNQVYNSENSFGATYGEHRENLELKNEKSRSWRSLFTRQPRRLQIASSIAIRSDST